MSPPQAGSSGAQPAETDHEQAAGRAAQAGEAEQQSSTADFGDAAGQDELAAAERGLESSFGLRRTDQLVLAALLSGALVLSGLHWARWSGWGTRPIEIDRPPDRQYAYKVDMNTANWVEWMQLPEIGETLARRIVEDRERRGPFQNIDELQRVHGIGPKTVERIRPWLREPATENAPAAVP